MRFRTFFVAHNAAESLFRRSAKGRICQEPQFASRIRPTRGARLSYGAGASGSAVKNADGEPLLHVVFVAPQIHWNTGNIGRTCVGLGARLHLVGPLGFSLDEKQVRRAGLDYWTHVDLRVHEDWNAFVSQTGALSAQVFYFTKFGTRTAADMCWPNNGRPLMLVFGSEIDGFDSIRTWIEENVPPECTVAFPMVHPEFRSFNLSTSASMVRSISTCCDFVHANIHANHCYLTFLRHFGTRTRRSRAHQLNSALCKQATFALLRSCSRCLLNVYLREKRFSLIICDARFVDCPQLEFTVRY